MRNALSELPVLLLCIRGGLIAGIGSALVRLPGRLYCLRLRGRRGKLLPKLLFGLLDVLAAAGTVVLLAYTLYRANGGEPRLYALLGFAAGAALTARAITRLTEGTRGPRDY